MPDFTALFSFLKSPKLAGPVFIFCGSILFLPFESLGIPKPALPTEVQTAIVVAFLLAAAILVADTVSWLFGILMQPLYKMKQAQQAEAILLSLNIEELCLLWAMANDGVKTIQGSFNNGLLLSLRRKGALYQMLGMQSANRLHHAMPDELYDVIRKRGFERFPKGFRESSDFKDRISEVVADAPNPRS